MITQSKILYGGLRALQRELEKPDWQGARYTIVVDENTFQPCLPLLVSSVEALQEADFVEVPSGEDCKSLEVAAQVWQTLLEGGADRDHVLVCLGGGAVCDLGGFVASGYMRGIRHVLVPTSLLAMADAAIGGKTAVDLGGVKNSVGHFYPAVLTVLDTGFLSTLPPHEWLNGRMEMVKTAAVTDPVLYERLVVEPEISPVDVKAVARIKQRIVRVDPRDRGVRRILNFGHTFGHAIEVCAHLPHGVAVGVGMQVAMYLSVRKLGLAEAVYTAYSQWLKAQLSAGGIHLSPFSLRDIEQMLPLMHRDKKCTDGALRCVLLQELGAAVIDVEVSDHEVRDAMLRVGKSF